MKTSFQKSMLTYLLYFLIISVGFVSCDGGGNDDDDDDNDTVPPTTTAEQPEDVKVKTPITPDDTSSSDDKDEPSTDKPPTTDTTPPDEETKPEEKIIVEFPITTDKKIFFTDGFGGYYIPPNTETEGNSCHAFNGTADCFSAGSLPLDGNRARVSPDGEHFMFTFGDATDRITATVKAKGNNTQPTDLKVFKNAESIGWLNNETILYAELENGTSTYKKLVKSNILGTQTEILRESAEGFVVDSRWFFDPSRTMIVVTEKKGSGSTIIVIPLSEPTAAFTLDRTTSVTNVVWTRSNHIVWLEGNKFFSTTFELGSPEGIELSFTPKDNFLIPWKEKDQVLVTQFVPNPDPDEIFPLPDSSNPLYEFYTVTMEGKLSLESTLSKLAITRYDVFFTLQIEKLVPSQDYTKILYVDKVTMYTNNFANTDEKRVYVEPVLDNLPVVDFAW